ncbi:MAG: 2-amino-4-hydroxy-6-hydroxymethyldihydropteridine diphosphokinase [Candidatus Cloacimonetes bacterium]|nr:2-amino-4-hydroxy-6-hydroxymethyldihydropteridine diphosphokinase [Candidatus Cloacimonadota bacterium]
MKCILCLGANLMEPIFQLEKAKELLEEHPNIKILRESSIRETAPYGYSDQPNFFNQVIEIETSLLPIGLLHIIQEIEITMGRLPSFRWGPRLIDIDIVLMEGIVFQSSELSIPHSDLENRMFLLELMLELIPNQIHPVTKISIKELYQNLKEKK